MSEKDDRDTTEVTIEIPTAWLEGIREGVERYGDLGKGSYWTDETMIARAAYDQWQADIAASTVEVGDVVQVTGSRISYLQRMKVMVIFTNRDGDTWAALVDGDGDPHPWKVVDDLTIVEKGGGPDGGV